jgi:archaeosine synthase
LESIVDISNRYGLARSGIWTLSGNRIRIPAIAGIDFYEPNLGFSFEIKTSNIPNGITRENISMTSLKSEDHQANLNRGSDNSNIKLRLINKINPLLSDNKYDNLSNSSIKGQPQQNIDENQSHLDLVLPQNILYPECFSDIGISPEAVFPSIEKHVQKNGFGINLIVSSADAFPPGPGLLVLNNALKLMNDPRKFVNRILEIEPRKDPNKLLYMPGIAKVNNLAILIYLGADIVDITQCILSARSGRLMIGTGEIPEEKAEHGLCSCDGCSERFGLGEGTSSNKLFNSVLKHNVLALFSELALIKTSLTLGTLRELVEQRIVTEPSLSSMVRIMDNQYYQVLERYFLVYKDQSFNTTSIEGINRVEVKRFRDRVINRFLKPEGAKILILLPCSAKKPYSRSKSHKLFSRAIHNAVLQKKGQNGGNSNLQDLIHEVIVTSPLGLVPRELELVYPAQQYDIPVTGHWFDDEVTMIKNELHQYLEKNVYDHIIIHLDHQLNTVIKEYLESIHVAVPSENKKNGTNSKTNFIITSSKSPTETNSLENLSNQLGEVLEQYSNEDLKIKKPKNFMRTDYWNVVSSVAQFQFDSPGLELVSGCEIRGRYPYLKILKAGEQLGMLTGERGLISLTLTGGKHLLNIKEFGYVIEIDDFTPKGSIMAVGVQTASDQIREGDEVIACHKGQLRAVGQAVMNGMEMEAATRGVAVKVRHHIK